VFGNRQAFVLRETSLWRLDEDYPLDYSNFMYRLETLESYCSYLLWNRMY